MSGQATPLPSVPYLEDRRFSYTPPFNNFGSRALCSEISEDGPERRHIYSSFVQSWLYFGLLEAFFSEWKIPVNKADFLEDTADNGRIVTSKFLQEYLVAYEHNEGQSTIADRDTTAEMDGFSFRSGAIKRARNRVSNTKLVPQKYHNELRQNVKADDVQPSIWDSIVILGATLARAKDLIFRPIRNDIKQEYRFVDYSIFRLRGIPDFRYDEERCPHERRILAQLVDGRLPEIAFFSQVRRSRPEQSYLECRESECVAYQIETTTYETRHVHDSCPCDFVGFEEGSVLTFDEEEDAAVSSSQADPWKLDPRDLDMDESELLEPQKPVAGPLEAELTSEQSSDSEISDPETLQQKSIKASTADSDSLQLKSSSGSDTFKPRPTMVARLKSQALQTPQAQYFSKKVPACMFKDGKLETVLLPHLKATVSGWLKMPMAGWNLVAISHVWADRLGNNRANKLPRCQLERLQGLANSLYKKDYHPVPFWIDTLMIPKYSASASSEDEKQKRTSLKTKALKNMEWVYKGSSKVLVLDTDLLSISTKDLQAEEIGAHLMTSVWSSRLWTLQEGCNKDRTLFQFADRVVSWPALHDDIQKKSKLGSWNSQLPKKHPARKAQSLDLVQINWKTTKFHLQDHFGFSSPKAKVFAKVDKRLYRVINQVWCSIHNFLEEFTIDWSGGFKPGALMRCMRGMYYRNCSNPADEPLVLSSLLSSLAGSAAELQSKSMTKEDRYKTLFKKLQYVPRDVLFVDQVRCQDYGCRWIPTSLLAVNNSLGKPVERSEHARSAYPISAFPYTRMGIAVVHIFPHGAGLILVPATSIYGLHRMRKNGPMCGQEKRGLVTRLTGLRILPRPTELTAPFCFKLHDEGSRPSSKSRSARWKVHLREPSTGRVYTEFPAADWCLLVNGSFQTMLETSTVPCEALLVAVTDGLTLRPGGVTRFEALALLVPLHEEDSEASEMPSVEVRLPSIISSVVSERWIVG